MREQIGTAEMDGLEAVLRKQLHLIGRHPRSLNLGFPNAFDRLNQRTGSGWGGNFRAH